jgi:4-diphosphocytidyl-2-C-methyl-D-erythritol kinase
MSAGRKARVPALAKVNLGLRVLYRRGDGFHEIRTVFQAISLADTLEIEYDASGSNSVTVESSIEIPDNLVAKAAALCLAEMNAGGAVRLRLKKRIPMGAGLGGGSSDAAAVLLALPVLAGIRIPLERLLVMAAALGSDVPFFLAGGRSVAIGRGTELYPLPDQPLRYAVLLAPGVHVSTVEAYQALGRRPETELTSEAQQNNIVSFQSQVWGGGAAQFQNDFESVVFERFPVLAECRKRLLAAGASQAGMTGSGSALFGIFRARDEATRAIQLLKGSFVRDAPAMFPVHTISSARYRAIWWRALREHVKDKLWPPQNRYAQ